MRRIVWSIVFACGAFGLAAGEAARAEDDGGQVVENVVVTAPPDPVGNEAFSVVRLDILALRAVPELDVALSQVPGLSLFRRNSSLSANPTTQGVSLRSIAPSGAGRALVTLDGVPQNDPFGGWVIWSSLPSEDIPGAQIVRGAGAGPYGAGALTGTIALSERQDDGLAAADAEAGELGTTRAAAAGGTQIGAAGLFGSLSYQHSDGWIPVDAAQRGAADNDVTLLARNASLALKTEPFDGTALAARLGVYDERRGSGLVGSDSDARGISGSLTLAHPEGADALGWRLQAWIRDTNFSNISVSVAPGRVSTTPSDDQYATPALGWGANAALRGSDIWFASSFDWEVGADARFADGKSKEDVSFSSGAFTQGRVAGGRTFTGGIYAEGAGHFDGWLVTAGVRADAWNSTDGHLIQNMLSTGAITLNQAFSSNSGVVPTGRVGAKYDLADGLYLRSAAYAGFRAPSLNELYRPFRLGNNVTEANAALTPEELYGIESGIGGEADDWSWDATLFWNQLHNAVTNVTVGMGPGTFAGVGFIPAGGLLIQRQNAGDIDALGVEAEGRLKLGDRLSLNAGFALTDAHVSGGTEAPQLTGKRPAQAPRWTATGGVVVTPAAPLTLDLLLRYESARFADDLNTLRLGSALTADAKLAWALTSAFSLYAAVDNLTDARVATTEGADLVASYDAPRLWRVGITFAQ